MKAATGFYKFLNDMNASFAKSGTKSHRLQKSIEQTESEIAEVIQELNGLSLLLTNFQVCEEIAGVSGLGVTLSRLAKSLELSGHQLGVLWQTIGEFDGEPGTDCDESAGATPT